MTTATKKVLSVLAGGVGMSVAEIATATGLTMGQVRMAIPLLREAESVVSVPAVARYFITDSGHMRLRHVPVTPPQVIERKARARQKRRLEMQEAALLTITHAKEHAPNSVFALGGMS